MLRSYYWILHLAMIAAGAYLTADMANLALGSYLDRSLGAAAPSAAPLNDRGAPGEEAQGADYHYVLRRNIFNSQARPLSPENHDPSGPAPAAPPPAALSPLNLTLVGTVIPKHGLPYAVFSESNRSEQTIFRLGDLVGENATLIEINRHQTIIQRGDQQEVIELAVNPEAGAGGVRPVARRAAPSIPNPEPASSFGDTIRQVSENQWLLDRREIDSAMTNLPQLLTKARIIPNFKDGKPDGFRIFAIAQDSLYSKIGLNNGDILNRINGIDVKDPQNFVKVLEQLKDENSIHIDLVRNNQKQTFDYEIR